MKVNFEFDTEWITNPFKSIYHKIWTILNRSPKPLPCPICGHEPWLRFGEDVRCDECSIMSNHPHSPVIWHRGHTDAGIRAWNHWVKQFDKDDKNTWCAEVCLNYFEWYHLGYTDKTMTKNASSYENDDGSRGYRSCFDSRRMHIGKITGPHCMEDKHLEKIFGKDSTVYLKKSFYQKIKELFNIWS